MNNIEDRFLNNKYTSLYFKIINNALIQKRKRVGRDNKNYVYYEIHHILPKSIFPEYKNLLTFPWNGVLLTAREHFIVHMLLTKMCITNDQAISMKQAFYMMSSYSNKLTTSKLYSKMREELSNNLSQRLTGISKPKEQSAKMIETKRKNGTLYHTEEAKQRMSQVQKGKIITQEDRDKKSKALKGKPKSEQHKQNLSKALKGRDFTDSWRAALSKAAKGRQVSVQTREKLSRASKGKSKNLSQEQRAVKRTLAQRQITCVYCEQTFAISTHSRYHGEKCKLKP